MVDTSGDIPFQETSKEAEAHAYIMILHAEQSQ